MLISHTRPGRIVVLFALLLCVGCNDAAPKPPVLDTGAGPDASEERASVYLLFDPQDCFTCEAEMARWVAHRREYPSRVFIVLTRRPSASERQAIAVRRIPIDGVSQDRRLRKAERGGRAFLFQGPELVREGRTADAELMTTIEQELGR